MRRNLIYFAANPWNFIKQREQHIMENLSKFYDTYYVEKPIVRLGRFPSMKPILNRISDGLNVVQAGDGFFPFNNRYSTVAKLNEIIFSHALTSFLSSELGINKIDILGTGFPRFGRVFGQLKARVKYFDLMDNVEAFNGQCNSSVVRDQVKLISSIADFVVVSADKLKEKVPEAKKVITINNGVTGQFVNSENIPWPADLPSGRPIIGYIGLISKWFDFEFVRSLANECLNYNIVIIGPCEEKEEMANLVGGNIYHLGLKLHSDLPAYLRQFDFGMIPFLVNELTVYVNPVKLYEYWAFGLPVISSNLPEVAKYKEGIGIRGDNFSFKSFFKDASAWNRDSIRRMAIQNTWESRSHQLRMEIESRLPSLNSEIESLG